MAVLAKVGAGIRDDTEKCQKRPNIEAKDYKGNETC
jgi:hypothetical protein